MANPTMKLALVGGALALGLSSGVMAEGPTAKMLSDTCAGCHGANGNSVGPASPSIAGMDALAFVDTMKAFQEGDAYSTIMGRIAKGYTDEELESMAGYFHEQEFVAVTQDFDKDKVAAGEKLHDKYCEKCHIEGGKAVPDEEDYYILAGQWTPYLQYAMADFQAGRSEMAKKMKKKLKQMHEAKGDDAMVALYAYYASQQ